MQLSKNTQINIPLTLQHIETHVRTGLEANYTTVAQTWKVLQKMANMSMKNIGMIDEWWVAEATISHTLGL